MQKPKVNQLWRIGSENIYQIEEIKEDMVFVRRFSGTQDGIMLGWMRWKPKWWWKLIGTLEE